MPAIDLQTLAYVLAVIMVALGVAGTVLPALPGVPLVFSGLLLAAWAGGFERVGPWVLGLLGALTLLSVLVDLLASVLGAQRVGASRLALAGAFAGSLVGLFFGIPGLLAGPFVGALAGELLHGRHVGRATRVGLATWIGLLVGTILKVGLAVAMLGVFVLAWLL